MRCSKARKLMFKFFEEDLKEKEMVQIKEHLRDCPWCVSEYKKGKKVLNGLGSFETKVVPDSLHKSIMQEVCGMDTFIKEEKKENKIIFKRGVRRVACLCVAVFIVAFCLSFIDFDVIKEEGINGLTKLANITKVETTKDESRDDSLFGDVLQLRSASKNEEDASESTEVSYDTTAESTSEDLYTENTSLMETNLDDESINDIETNDDEETKSYLDEIITNKGFYTVDSYYDYLNNEDNVTKKSILEIYTTLFDEACDNVNSITNKYGANIYYSNIYFNENGDGYQTGVFAIRVIKDNFNNLKSELSKLGKADINVVQDDFKVTSTQDFNELLETCMKNKEEYENEIKNLDEDDLDYDTKKTTLEEKISAEEESIYNIEKALEDSNNTTEVINIELTIKECSDIDLEGIISKNTFAKTIVKNFKVGCQNFVRMIQDSFLWVCENIIFIIFYLILFLIAWTIIKAIFLKDRD